jgi:hypothetical protein
MAPALAGFSKFGFLAFWGAETAIIGKLLGQGESRFSAGTAGPPKMRPTDGLAKNWIVQPDRTQKTPMRAAARFYRPVAANRKTGSGARSA